SYVFKDSDHITILNGVNTSIFNKKDISSLADEYKLTDKKIVLYVSSGFKNPMKGTEYFIKLANKLIESDFVFLVIGDAQAVTLPENCIKLGVINNQNKLAEFYSLADVTLITSYRESFSMIVAESLSCGTPVAGFKAGGPESISIKEYSKFVDYGDVE